MKIYYVVFSLGCFLVKADSVELVKKQAQNEYGYSFGPYRIRRATKKDIEWVEGMGGQVPE